MQSDPNKESAGAVSSPDGDEGGAQVGWGVGDDSDDAFRTRRTVFSVIAVIVVCMGAWMLLTMLATRQSEGPVLSAEGPADGGRVYTVVLRRIDPQQREAMRRLVSAAPIRRMAGRNEFRFMELQNGEVAICVGRFEDPGSARAEELLSKFREFSTNGGSRPFRAASLMGYPK